MPDLNILLIDFRRDDPCGRLLSFIKGTHKGSPYGIKGIRKECPYGLKIKFYFPEPLWKKAKPGNQTENNTRTVGEHVIEFHKTILSLTECF